MSRPTTHQLHLGVLLVLRLSVCATECEKNMADAQAWLRQNEGAVADLDNQSVMSAYSKISGAGSRINTIDEERRTTSMAGALDWLRPNSATPADIDDISVVSFRTLGGAKLGVIKEPGKEMADALDWLRKNYTVQGPLDGPSVISSCSKASNLAATPLDEEKRAQAMEGALDWLRESNISTGDLTMQRSPRSIR
jgi:hypothetical protein